MWKKVPSFWLHVSDSLVDQPHKLAVLAVELELVWPRLVVSHHGLVDVISACFRDFENWPAFCERSVVDHVLRVVVPVVKFILDTVDHHLVEEDGYSVGKKVCAGDGQRASELEVLV